jgi:hypothetical protein
MFKNINRICGIHKIYQHQMWHMGLPLLLLLITAIALSACSQPTVEATSLPTENMVETLVAAKLTQVSSEQATLQASTPSAPPASETPIPEITESPTATATATITPTQQAMNVSGKVCFPGKNIPAMTVYFENTKDQQVVEVSIQENQDRYQVNLPSGEYLAYAWLNDFSRGGLYSKAVPCGLKASCEDHSALPFNVTDGEQNTAIDLCDWYSGPFNVPYPPGKEATDVTGSISGALDYPGGSTPALQVFAFNLNTNNWYYINTNPGWSAYTLGELPPGNYHVVAYDADGNSGGHADASHNLITVTVKAGEKVSGVDTNDWNAPASAFPANPTR